MTLIGKDELDKLTEHPIWTTLMDEIEASGGFGEGNSNETHHALGLDEDGVKDWCKREALNDLELVTGMPEELVTAGAMLVTPAVKVVAMIATGYHLGIIKGLVLANERELA